ncbi:MAG TPA: hypothetical protein VFS20_04785, partial [Longimicrobium sp.]|nr:hypothetical protein [Longimicrobium sp.]
MATTRRTAGRGMMIGACAALALGACRDRAQPPPQQGQPPDAPQAAARVDLTMRVPDQPPWNGDDTLVVTIQNATQAPVADAVLKLFVQGPLAAPVDSGSAARAEVVDSGGTRLRFEV